MKKETRGGKREGSGRPKSEPTKTLTFRVPERIADIARIEGNKLFLKLKNKKNDKSK